MRAVIVSEPGGPEALRIEEVEKPSIRPDQVLIRTAGAGVNRADLLQRRGFYPPPPGESDVIGLEVSGFVVEAGREVSTWKRGAQCIALLAGGGYAEYVAVNAGQVIAPPPGIDLVSAAGIIEVAATVVSNLDHVHLSSGETLLVHGGTGGIGTFAIQYAKALGARVIATAGSADKLDICRDLGADVALDYHDDWAAAVKDVTGQGADVILDVMGAKYLEANVGSLAPDGRLVVIGLQGGRKGTLDLSVLLSKRATVTATNLRGRPTVQKAAICCQVAERVWPLYESGRIRHPHETRIPFEDVARAHELLESGSNIGKIVLEF